MERRGVPVIRYADDIVVLAKSKRAAERLQETTQRYLAGKLKLRMNVEKSKVVSVFAIRNFKFLGFALGKGKNGIYIRAHTKSLKKAKAKLKELTSRKMGYVQVDSFMRTEIPGIFGAGDCITKHLRQVVTACADGAIAAQSASNYIKSLC